MTSRSGAQEKVYLGIAVTVTAVWVIATLVQVAFPERVVPTYVNIIMVTVAAAFFGAHGVKSARRNGNGGGT